MEGCDTVSAVHCTTLRLQLQERRAGNSAYQQSQFSTALHHYRRALAVVDFVVGQSPHDQAEVEANRAATLLNMAAAHMGLQEWGAAVQCCDDALGVKGAQSSTAACRAWLRRAKANLGRHEYQVRGAARGAGPTGWGLPYGGI